MLLKGRTLEGIRAGAITLQFRRWRRPTVKAGGTLSTAIGRLCIDAVDPVDPAAITPAEAAAAGFAGLDDLHALLGRRAEGEVYRIRLRPCGPDPRVALRASVPDASGIASIVARLERMDARSASGPWTEATLDAIARRPGVRAGDLAEELGRERAPFKVDVRKLKALGLTESLEVGSRLSPRGRAVLERTRGL